MQPFRAVRAPSGADTEYGSASVLRPPSQMHLPLLVFLKQCEVCGWEAFLLVVFKAGLFKFAPLKLAA